VRIIGGTPQRPIHHPTRRPSRSTSRATCRSDIKSSAVVLGPRPSSVSSSSRNLTPAPGSDAGGARDDFVGRPDLIFVGRSDLPQGDEPKLGQDQDTVGVGGAGRRKRSHARLISARLCGKGIHAPPICVHPIADALCAVEPQ